MTKLHTFSIRQCPPLERQIQVLVTSYSLDLRGCVPKMTNIEYGELGLSVDHMIGRSLSRSLSRSTENCRHATSATSDNARLEIFIPIGLPSLISGGTQKPSQRAWREIKFAWAPRLSWFHGYKGETNSGELPRITTQECEPKISWMPGTSSRRKN